MVLMVSTVLEQKSIAANIDEAYSFKSAPCLNPSRSVFLKHSCSDLFTLDLDSFTSWSCSEYNYRFSCTKMTDANFYI